MHNSTIVGIFIVIVLITGIVISVLWRKADKSKNVYYRLGVYGLIYLGMLFRTLEDLAKSITNGNYLFALFCIFIIITMLFGFVFAIDERWLFKLIRSKKARKK